MPSVAGIDEAIDIEPDTWALVKPVLWGSSPLAQAVAPKTHRTKFKGRNARVTTIDGRAERERGQREARA
ncbi:hypothetical protein [Nannocystis bainbridge]|uniref:Transposase n=1 Tax=Nannocystis bainbridge TaxID=2995303 RepID=A0ABT5DUY8_9BACT|nr:hypothetical protein [Nannocystis bainbridge]MDC0717457.1 hypothetical protein [Nannocystis bainbridge]